jgi:hypothetical protein
MFRSLFDHHQGYLYLYVRVFSNNTSSFWSWWWSWSFIFVLVIPEHGVSSDHTAKSIGLTIFFYSCHIFSLFILILKHFSTMLGTCNFSRKLVCLCLSNLVLLKSGHKNLIVLHICISIIQNPYFRNLPKCCLRCDVTQEYFCFVVISLPKCFFFCCIYFITVSDFWLNSIFRFSGHDSKIIKIGYLVSFCLINFCF